VECSGQRPVTSPQGDEEVWGLPKSSRYRGDFRGVLASLGKVKEDLTTSGSAQVPTPWVHCSAPGSWTGGTRDDRGRKGVGGGGRGGRGGMGGI